MAAKTTAAAGLWSATGTWTGGVVPVSGDTVTLNHVVSINDARTIGTSGTSATVVLAINAALTFLSGSTLTCKGSVNQANATVTFASGSAFVFDASGAGTPSTAKYSWSISTANSQANAVIIANGTAANPVSISSNNASSAGNGFFKGGATLARGGRMQCTYVNFTRIGDATNDFNVYDVGSSTDSVFFDHCIFDTCSGDHNVGGIVSDSVIRYTYCTWKNSFSANPQNLGTSGTITAPGERTIFNCVYDTQPQWYAPGSMSISYNWFAQAPDMTTAAYSLFDHNFVRLTNGLVGVATADQKDSIYYFSDPSGSNPHYLTFDPDAPSMTLDGLIFEFDGTDDQGDCVLFKETTNPTTHSLQNIILVPNENGSQPGTLATFPGVVNSNGRIRNCTYVSTGGAPGVSAEESSTGHVGQLELLQNCIVYTPTAAIGTGLGFKVKNQFIPAPGTTNFISASAADYNTGWQIGSGSLGKGYDVAMSGTPGVHDIEGDPQFVDMTRNLKTWDTSLGGPGTRANALTQMQKMNDRSGYNSAYNITAYLAYIRGGFTPQRSELLTGGFGGTYIGAVLPIIAGGGNTLTSPNTTGMIWPMRNRSKLSTSIGGLLYPRPKLPR